MNQPSESKWEVQDTANQTICNEMEQNDKDITTDNKATIETNLKYDDDSVLNRLLDLESPVLYDTMLPYLCEKEHLDRVLEYLIKDYIRTDNSIGDRSEFTDERCEKINSFFMSNDEALNTLLTKTNSYVVLYVLDVLLYNNDTGTANNYELATFIKYVLVKLPNQIFPYLQEDDIRQMLMIVNKNRPIYDILILILSYPEKRYDLEEEIKQNKTIIDEASCYDEESNQSIDSCYNVSNKVLTTHIRHLAHIHILPSIIVVITDEKTNPETSDLLCMLLCDILYKYSYNPKYKCVIKELVNDQLIHSIMMFIKRKANLYNTQLLERILYLISVCEIPVAPDNYIKFGLLVEDYLANEFATLAVPMYNIISMYIMFLIKQLYRYLPSPAQLCSALDSRFHLIDTFVLGDLTRTNSLRTLDDMHIDNIALSLFKSIYYIILGFYCRQGENLTIVDDINPLFWNLLYALPFIYPEHHILLSFNCLLYIIISVLRDYHALFIFNRYNTHILSETPFIQYCYEEYNKRDTELKGHIRRIINQLRLRKEQIIMEGQRMQDEKDLISILKRDYYYQKLLPLVIADSVKEVCLAQQKKVIQNGVATDCDIESLLKEAETTKCLDIGSEFAKQLGFAIY